MALILKNTQFIDWQTGNVTSGHVKVEPGSEGGLFVANKLDKFGPLGPGDKTIDCQGKLVTKAFACGHHHIYSTLARGMPAPKKSPTNFEEILTYVWWHLDKCLDLEMIEASALASALYCAKNGVTFVIDHHASPYAIEGSLNTIARAFDKVGISHLLCYELSDRDGEGPREAGLAEHESYLAGGGQGHLGLHASFTVGDDLLNRSVEMARRFQTGLHIHVAEDLADQAACLRDHGKRVVTRLHEAGGLDLPQTILGHCIHLDDQEKALIRDAGTWVVQNTESNLNNNVGLANYNHITDKVMLGTDGMHCDMLRSAKASFLSGQPVEGTGFDTIYTRFRNVHRYLAECGFQGDGDNNLVILDYDSPTELTSDNFLGHFVYGINSSHVETVIAGGEVIVENRVATRVDEAEILAHARQMGNKLWDKMK
jgi:cytosine/adenosine deaminase-related metal-dependent hydrolase|nr:amidohydrolase family protein [Candidatus Krumholzibacteria bacterium]